jgi:hypothetical protein
VGGEAVPTDATDFDQVPRSSTARWRATAAWTAW